MRALNTRTATEASSDLATSLRRHARYTLAKEWDDLNARDRYLAVALAVREPVIDRLLDTRRRQDESDAKWLAYLSMEYLIGRSLENNLQNLGLLDECRQALSELGIELEQVSEEEADAALGNGGLGRLAACFLDSLATLNLPATGYGINYEFGLFKQEIDNGYQKERPDHWLAHGTLWEIKRPDESCFIPVYGRIEHSEDDQHNYKALWVDSKMLVGVPHDIPIVGYGGGTVNVLRLYSARSSYEFDMQIFNKGDYVRAVEQKITSEVVSKVLYPSDTVENGRELRLIQEYFLVACALRDTMARFRKRGHDLERLPSFVAIQMNDTHPALAVAELMRLLVDECGLPWNPSWRITRGCLAYTNHTLLPEALEKWPIPLLERVLPRHLQIIHEINRRFLDEVRLSSSGDAARLARMSIVEDGSPGHVRMSHLAMVGSHSTNGVAALHTELLRRTLAPDFSELWPERFNNKTNGVTQRRWLLKANPDLAGLITDAIGERWITDLENLRELEPLAGDAGFQEDFDRVKLGNKRSLYSVVRDACGVQIDPESLFDVQVKRIHEYKRQLLNCLHIIYLYLTIVEDGLEPAAPRTCILAGKAAPGYWVAKQIIKLINNLGRVINNDPRVRGLLRVAFVPDYRVSLAERIIPAANLSEQISTAGREASGTGNMKLALNGALTIGTLDGATIEMMQDIGEENMYIFGLRADDVQRLIAEGSYAPREVHRTNECVRRAVEALGSNMFCPDEPGLFDWAYNSLLERDEYFHLADLPSYVEAQQRAADEFQHSALWTRKAILNVARIGRFSSDRAVREYATDVWGLVPV